MAVNIANVPATPLGAGAPGVGSGLLLSGGTLNVPGWMFPVANAAISAVGLSASTIGWSLSDGTNGQSDFVSVAGGSGTVTFPSSPRGGVALVSSTGTANRWGCGASVSTMIGNLKTDRWYVYVYAKLSAGDANSSHEMCLAPGGGFTTVTGVNNGVGFQAVNNALNFVVNNAGSLTTVATGWTYDTTLYHEFVFYNDTSNVKAFVDGVLVATVANSAVGASLGCQHSCVAANGATAATRTVAVDKIATFFDRPT